MKRYFIFAWLIFISTGIAAKDYNASLFGIESNGTANNTSSIQKAIDYIHARGGGTLVFYVGRYLTGAIVLKSNVYIRLEEGAVLAGTSSPYDYINSENTPALIFADGQSNVGVSGKGVIEGSGYVFLKNSNDLAKRGYLKKEIRPGLVAFNNCTNVSVSGLNLWDGPYRALILSDCKDVSIDGLHINGKKIPSSAGILIEKCKWVTMQHLFIKVMQEPFVARDNQHVVVQDSITDSGASLSESLK